MKPSSTRQKVGLVLAGLLSLSSIPSVLAPTPDGEVGAPFGILVLSSVLGVVGLVAVVVAWVRSSGTAIRVAAGCLIVTLLGSLPAFFVDVPAIVRFGTAASALVTVLTIALMFSGVRGNAVGAEGSAS
ncbi:hypothetical protein [Knoellia subterranea]|uniref:Uncharacterized protein n=1 Tax=Knoellia subterranea KCTC 19937 TaxID=1385521 RepID=A0A0A0JJ90_9MICO|nr:hypothetical protein [Knoellia subterranea]KGN36844.1 hypothetical protein N803_17380 [Knoellia subterranea KCTC 19937]